MLQSEPEITDKNGMPYLMDDKVDPDGNRIIGRGEICMRGPCISSGYYKMPEKTAEEYDENGWFHTGDIGQFTDDGVIQIVDRKKNLVKLKGGEYVAVEAMECAFVQSPMVSAVCVIANGDLDRATALVTVQDAQLEKWADEADVSYGSITKLTRMPETKRAVLKSMLACGKEAGLNPLELGMRDCELLPGVEWLPGTGMTATMKIDRKKIAQLHAAELEALLKRNM
jgi:long-chain acyl-CoA synthetase